MHWDARFGVYWEPYQGLQVEEKRGVDALDALDAFSRLVGPACVLVVKRAWIVTEADDTITLDWNSKDGVTFPLEGDPSHARMVALYPARSR